jgi:hypothetical protein
MSRALTSILRCKKKRLGVGGNDSLARIALAKNPVKVSITVDMLAIDQQYQYCQVDKGN